MASIVNKYIDSASFETATAVYEDINLISKAVDGVYRNNSQYRIQLNGLLGPLFDCPSCIESTLIDVCYDPSSEVEACCNCGEEPVASNYNGLISALNCSQNTNNLINLATTFGPEFEVGDINVRSASTSTPVPNGIYRGIELRSGVNLSDGAYSPSALTNASESISDYIIEIQNGTVVSKTSCPQ
jgi:hypothetical protein